MERSNKKTTGKNKRSVDEITRETYDWWGRSIVFIKSTKIQSWKAIFIIAFISGAATALIWSVSLKIQTMSDAAAGAELSLFAADQTVTKGDPVNVQIDLNTHSNNVVAVKAIVKYNLSDFSLTRDNIDTLSGSFGIDKCSPDETPTGICSLVSVGVDEADATKGKAIITVAKQHPGLVGDSLVVAKLNFTSLRVVTPEEPNITLSYEQGSYADSDVIVDDVNGTDILAGVVGTSIAAVGQACDPNGYTFFNYGTCHYDANLDDWVNEFTVTGRTPEDCVGTPSDDQIYVPCDHPACTDTSFDYAYSQSSWIPAICPPSEKQTRTLNPDIDTEPPLCEGGSQPILEQTCKFVPPACEYSYTNCTECSGGNKTCTVTKTNEPCDEETPPSNIVSCTECIYECTKWNPTNCPETQKHTCTEEKLASVSDSDCSGGTHKVNEIEDCVYNPPACIYVLGDWTPEICPKNHIQTRTVTNTNADYCIESGTRPVDQLDTCTYEPPTCSYTYTAWTPEVCPAGGGTQTRTETKGGEADCEGGVRQPTEQTCTPETCQAFDYSAWTPSVCPASQTQTRTATPTSPVGCTGGNPQISQSCTYITPPSDKHKSSHHKKKKKKKAVAVKKVSGDKTGPVLQIPLLLNKNRGDRVWWTGSDTSGISYYTYKFRNSTIRTIAPSFNIPVNTPSGIYIVIIRGYDKAGNGSMRIVTIRVR